MYDNLKDFCGAEAQKSKTNSLKLRVAALFTQPIIGISEAVKVGIKLCELLQQAEIDKPSPECAQLRDLLISDLKQIMPAFTEHLATAAVAKAPLAEIRVILQKLLPIQPVVSDSFQSIQHPSVLRNIGYLGQFDPTAEYGDDALMLDLQRMDMSLCVDGDNPLQPLEESLLSVALNDMSKFFDKLEAAGGRVSDEDRSSDQKNIDFLLATVSKYRRQVIQKRLFDFLKDAIQLDDALIKFIYFYIPQRAGGEFYTRFDALNGLVDLWKEAFVITGGSFDSTIYASVEQNDRLQIETVYRYKNVMERDAADNLPLNKSSLYALTVRQSIALRYAKGNKLQVESFNVAFDDGTQGSKLKSFLQQEGLLTTQSLEFAILNGDNKHLMQLFGFGNSDFLNLSHFPDGKEAASRITPLQFAMLAGQVGVAEKLRLLGNDQPNAFGKTSYDYAWGNSELVQLLAPNGELLPGDNDAQVILSYELPLITGDISRLTNNNYIKLAKAIKRQPDDVKFALKDHPCSSRSRSEASSQMVMKNFLRAVWHIYSNKSIRQYQQDNFDGLCGSLNERGIQVIRSEQRWRIFESAEEKSLKFVFAITAFKYADESAGRKEIYGVADGGAVATLEFTYAFHPGFQTVTLEVAFRDATLHQPIRKELSKGGGISLTTLSHPKELVPEPRSASPAQSGLWSPAPSDASDAESGAEQQSYISTGTVLTEVSDFEDDEDSQRSRPASP